MRTRPVNGVGPIGTNLRLLAGMHGLRQRELAQQIGISEQGLWNIVHGRSEPRTRTVAACAHVFAISVETLLGDTGDCLRAAAANFEDAPAQRVGEALA